MNPHSLNFDLHYEDLDVDGKIVLEWILGWDGMDWIHLVQDRDQWRAPVNVVMSPWVS
jgi:hypothetical protein